MGRRLTVSFDLDGTLTNSSFVDSVWLEGIPSLIAQRQGGDLPSARDLCIEAYTKVGDDSLLWYRLPYWLDYFGLGDVEPVSLIQRYASRIEVFEDVHPVLEGLAQEGFTLILFSNASRDFLDIEVAQGGLEPYFSRLISVSDDWGTVKASPASFIRLREEVSGDLVHAGDHLKFDYEVPMSVGIPAYHICRDHGLKRISSLDDLHQFARAVTGGRR